MGTPRRAPTAENEVVVRAIERFRAHLRERSLKASKVREEIARAALMHEGHFSVEELARTLQARNVKDAHIATVYRAIPLLIETGMIQPALVATDDSQRYEAAFEREHHDHLVCMSCGRVVEYHSEALEALQREIALRYDFELDDHVHVLRGRCKDCRQGAPVRKRARPAASKPAAKVKTARHR